MYITRFPFVIWPEMYPVFLLFRTVKCGDVSRDRLDIGGSKDFDTVNMQLSTSVCGHSEESGPAQAIFCELTTARLISHGNHNNQVIVSIRTADENDLDAATLACSL